MKQTLEISHSPPAAAAAAEFPLQLPLIFNEPEVLVPIRSYHCQYSCQKNNQIAGQ